MTLNHSILIVFAALTLTSISAGAFITPGGPRPPGFPGGGPPPIPDVDGGIIGGPNGPNGPGFPPVMPGYPGDDIGNGRQERKVIYLNRQLFNETLSLRQLAGIGENYRGYTVESVIVEVQYSDYNSEIVLLADGRQEDSSYSPQGSIQLRPRYRAVIGQDLRTLQLSIRGSASIGAITINLTQGDQIGRPPGRPQPGRTQDVPLFVSRRMYGTGHLDLTQYIDMRRYRGYRVWKS